MPSIDKEPIRLSIDADQPPSHPAAPRKIHETGPLLAHIDILSLVARYLDDGRPHELARCLNVSRVFYEAMAPRLHRHVRLPYCEFFMTRGGRRSCVICLNAGRTVKPGSYCRHTFKNRPFSTDQIGRALDRDVTARQLGPHSDCHTFAKNFSLPLLRTVDIETGAFFQRFCSHGTGECNFLPRDRLIRLISSHLCSGSLCQYHVPLALQSGRVNTLAVRLPGDLTTFPPCGMPLPTSVTAFRPKRLAILFPILTKLELREASIKRPSIFLHRPDSMRGRPISQEFFYRIANMCTRTQHASQILVVAADHCSLKIANLHFYDSSLDQSKGDLFWGHWPIGPNIIREPSHYGKRGQLCGLIEPPHRRQWPSVYRHAHPIVAARVGVMMQLLRPWIDEVFEEIYLERWQDARLSLDEEESVTGSKPTKRARLEDNANSSSTKVDVRPTYEQIDEARMALHAQIRPMTFKEYNDLEGNMDQLADPSEHC
jgi:hypothetical protein